MSSPPDTGAPSGRGRLRARFVVAVTIGIFVISSAVAFLTYSLCARYLVEQKERSLTNQSWSDARLIEQLVATEGIDDVADDLAVAHGSAIVIRAEGRWTASNAKVGPAEVPVALRAAVASGAVAHQRVRVLGRPSLVVGVPIDGASTAVYEVFFLRVLDSTLHIVSIALVAGVALATLLGAGLALWAARFVFRPLVETASTAQRIAAGDRHARLQITGDRDLTTLARSFNEMVDDLEARIEREHRLSADVSHELRSPLTSLAATVAMLERRRNQMSPEVAGLVDEVRVDSDRLVHLVEDLLELSRLDAGAEALQLEAVVPVDFIRRSAARASGSEVPVIADPSGPTDEPVQLDRRRVTRVVENLVTNARDYAGGLTEIRVARDNGHLVVEFEDAGPGVPPEDRERIFERFSRGSAVAFDGDGARAGSGLGLALVSEQVGVHGGRVWVRERDGGPGAVFVVELPVGSVP